MIKNEFRIVILKIKLPMCNMLLVNTKENSHLIF